MSAYMFICTPDQYPERVKPGNGRWWSCGSATQSGDQVFVYVTGVGVAYEWRATSDAKPNKTWKYECDVRYVAKIAPPIPIKSLKAAIAKSIWTPPHSNFWGHQALNLPTKVVAILERLRGRTIESLEQVEREFSKKVKAAQKMSPAQRRRHIAEASKKPSVSQVTTTVFSRNQFVAAEVLGRAKGNCESCKNPAPFRKASDGKPYLEVHHRIRLADGGNDTVKNAIALCPNCHRAAHFGTKSK